MLRELDVSLPTGWGVATYPAGASFGPRVMRDWEFVWLMEGDAEYRWGKNTVAAPEGAIVLCRPGATDAFRWDARRRTRHGYFHFQVNRFPDEWLPTTQWPFVRLPEPHDILHPLFRHLLNWQGRWNDLQCRLTIAHLLAAFVSGDVAAGEAPRVSWPDPVERAWAAIHGRLEEQPNVVLCLADLAAVACVTPEHLCRLFQAATGRSPMETVRLARLDRAASLLTRSNYSVAEIAELCGFASPFHFSRRFQDAFGQSPSGLRHAVQAGQTPPLPRLLHRHNGSTI